MLILQKPAGYCFSQNIPDIVIQKEGAETSVDFVLKIGATVIISENYLFDAEGLVYIRDISDLVSPYLVAAIAVSGNLIITTGLISEFVFTLNAGGNNSFTAIKCEADMPSGVSAETFAKQNFLTRLPREKRTATNRNEYLSYIHFGTYAEVVAHYKCVYLVDGVRTEKSGQLLTVAAGAGDRYISFNASLGIVRTASELQVEEIIQYDIWFTEDALQLESNVFTFLPEYVFYRNKKNFVFINSFGVLETLTTTGRADIKKNNEINLANIQSRYRKTSQDFSAETSINTGFLTDGEMEWLDDLLLSYDVAIYTPGIDGASEEITLTSSDKTDTDANEMQAFSFSYRRAKNNHLQFTAVAKGIFDETFDQTFT